MPIKTHNIPISHNLEFLLHSLADILPKCESNLTELVWIFSGISELDFRHDFYQVITLYPPDQYALTIVLPNTLQIGYSEFFHPLVRVFLVDNKNLFEWACSCSVNCIQVVSGRNFLFQRKSLFVSASMLSAWQQEVCYDYEFHDLHIENISKGIIHPLFRSDTGVGENNEYGGVTTSEFEFVTFSATPRINGRYQHYAAAPEWYVGANPSLSPDSIPYIDHDVVFIGPLHKHFGHFILESLSRLWFFLEAQNKGYLAAYISSPGDDPFIEFLAFFGINPDRLIRIDSPIQFRSVIVPEPSIRLHDRFHIKYKLCVDRIKESIEPASYKKVFFAKKMRLNHRGIGEQPIVDIFRENGFHIAYPEIISLREMLSLLKGCDTFAASSGSNAHHAIFLRDNVELICLNRSPHIHYPQTMIDRMKGLNTSYVDAYFSVLPADWSTGPFLFGPNKCLLEFFNHKSFAYDYNKLLYSSLPYFYEYFRIWGFYYSDENNRKLIDPEEMDVSVETLSEGINHIFGPLSVSY
ncbi:MAG: glycosyltransferase family 61 protein [Methylococcaceae bacterium]